MKQIESFTFTALLLAPLAALHAADAPRTHNLERLAEAAQL